MSTSLMIFNCLMGRQPALVDLDGISDVGQILILAISTPEFLSDVVLPAASRNDLKPILTAPVTAWAGHMADVAPLTRRGRAQVSAAKSRLAMLGALMGDRKFLDEVHAKARLSWPAEVFARIPVIESSATPNRGVIVSLLVPVYNTPPAILEATIRSVLAQTYQGWELCICDDASTSTSTRYVLDRFRGSDPRIKIIRNATNLHIAGATNAASELATGEFIGLLDHDDLLTPDALERMVAAAIAEPLADVLYSDEDKLELDGSFSEPYLKPDWSPDHLISVAYILHFMLVRKSLLFDIGGFRDAYTGAQDYDLTLRATARARKVIHVPGVLYHWRKIPGSASATVDAKPQALINAQAAVTEFVRLQDEEARVTPGLFTGSFRVHWPINAERPVTLLMLTDSVIREVEGRGEILLPEHAANSILDKSTFRNFELVILDNGRMPPDVCGRLAARGVRIESYRFEPPFNFCDKINKAFDLVYTEDVIILNDDIEVVSPDWIEALLSHSRRPGIGGVGARLLYPNNLNQHVGMALGVHGGCAHVFHNQPSEEVGYCGYTHVVRNYSAVTGAVLATRMSLVRWVGGFDRALAIDYNDVDFCLRLGEQGFRIVFTPFATLYHFEGYTIRRTEAAASETSKFGERWGQKIAADPYYNPGLPRDRTDFAVSAW